ncbi:hypothetical protein R1flu_010671 [Riccia fluitans]|uniref:DNA (cytosine-5-)-methyltransferase n=1 Tax=Riccia fluitans TaxID=41844 RepID=A0ABD1Z844_9MARC
MNGSAWSRFILAFDEKLYTFGQAKKLKVDSLAYCGTLMLFGSRSSFKQIPALEKNLGQTRTVKLGSRSLRSSYLAKMIIRRVESQTESSLDSEEEDNMDVSGFVDSDTDCILAEFFEMGFSVDETMAAIRETGSADRNELVEHLLKSQNTSTLAAGEMEAAVDRMTCVPQDVFVSVKQELDDDNYSSPFKPSYAVRIEPGLSPASTSSVSVDGPTGISDRLEGGKTPEKTETSKTSKKCPLLRRLLEMGCRSDVAETAYEIYADLLSAMAFIRSAGSDPAYGSEEEKLDLMCDYIAAVNLNEEDDDPEAEDQDENRGSETPLTDEDDEIEEYIRSRDCQALVVSNPPPAVNKRKNRIISFPELHQHEEEYIPGGYYKYIREPDPYLEELFQDDLEKQEGMALFAVKRRKTSEDSSSSSTSGKMVRKRPQVAKSLVGPVVRRIRVPSYKDMKGYGVPGTPIIHRKLPERHLEGPPYFYFENVASMPGDEWDTISRHLYDIEPEFVNSYHFTACKRPRGYIHNLPVEGRFEVQPRAPRTITELVPYTTRYWPTWDQRTTFNCICTYSPTESTIKPVAKLLEDKNSEKDSPSQIRRQILDVVRMHNLVWIGPQQLAKPKVEELEVCMGFDKDHTRPILSSNDQVKGLGNAFQVHTVGYHLSVLKGIFPEGVNILSLFSGIGGAEVALHKLGIKINVAVCVEIDVKARRVIEHWWKITNQTGRLITQYADVNELDYDTLQQLMKEVGGFDLLIGGSPCSNLSAKNRFTRMGLGGKASIAFFEYARILKDVRAFGIQHRHRCFHM